MILVVDMNYKPGSLAFNEFVKPIIAAAEPIERCVIKHYMELAPKELDRYSKVILSGNTLKDHETLQHLDRFEWIKTFNHPVLGICAGMQTVSRLYNVQLTPCLQIGMTEVETVKENPLFEGKFSVYTLHNYSVSPSEAFEVLAKSGSCIQAVKHKHRELYGVLFHPEVRNPDVIRRFLRLGC